MLMLLATSAGTGAGSALVQFGGGSSAYNTAGTLQFYAAANSTTLTGTKMLEITTAGGSVFSAGKITAAAATTSYASLNVPSGTAPTSPADGDIWFNGTALHVRVSGATYTLDMTAA